MAGSLYAIGRIVKAFGIKGELIVEPLTSVPERFRSMTGVLVGATEKQTASYDIEHAEIGGKGIRLRFAGCRDRTTAESLVGSFLFVPGEERVSLAEGSYFTDELIGLRVMTETGADVGILRDIMKLPAQDVYVIEGKDGRVLMPAVREFVRKVDMEAGVMVVRLIEGLPRE